MLYNLLTSTEKTSILETTLYAFLGFLVVFIGIAFLILIVWSIGKFFAKTNAVKKKPERGQTKNTVTNDIMPTTTEDISEETVAVITAALMAYYEQVNPKCEFTVRRIKRI